MLTSECVLIWYVRWVSCLNPRPHFWHLWGSRERVAVDLQVNFLVKPLAAEFAAEWLVVGMRTHMGVKVGSTVECFVALLTDVWLGRCVGELVTSQVTKLSEGAAALFADVRLVSSVNTFVRDEGTGASKCSATLITSMLGPGLFSIAVIVHHHLWLFVSSCCVGEISDVY